MATKAAELVSAYGDVSSAPGRRCQAQTIETIATETSSGITSATTVEDAYDAIFAIAVADRAVTTNSIGRATSVTTVQGKILTLNTLVAGSSYTDGSYTGVDLTGGTGTGATADITVAGNVVTVVTLVNGGAGYDVGEVLSADAADIGGTGTGFSITVATTTGPINA